MIERSCKDDAGTADRKKQQIFQALSARLVAEYGRGWGERHLRNCARIVEIFPDEKILHTLCAKLSWSHLRLIATLDDPLKRNFYTGLCRLEHWSVRRPIVGRAKAKRKRSVARQLWSS